MAADTWTLIGGGLLLVALIGHEAASLMLEKAAEHEGGHVGNVGVRETLAYAAFEATCVFARLSSFVEQLAGSAALSLGNALLARIHRRPSQPIARS